MDHHPPCPYLEALVATGSPWTEPPPWNRREQCFVLVNVLALIQPRPARCPMLLPQCAPAEASWGPLARPGW